MATPSLGFDNFFSTTLSAGVSSTDTTIPVNSVPTASEGYLVLEPDSASAREIIYYTSKTGSAVVCPSVSLGRGQGGTSATSHAINATVKGNVVAEHFESFNKLYHEPQGTLINGQIQRTVASNNLTVAIKTLSGADPTVENPVVVRIGNTVRSITSALSVTKNAGTNWFNSGSSEHATQDIDYFVYLGYNATDGVTIGYARIPYARVYGDFSATSTNDKHCAISTITNATSTDEYEVVGRFNASLSATASFNWSIPATSIIINRPIFETRVLTWVPQFTNITAGNGTHSSSYRISGKQVWLQQRFVLGSTSSVGSAPTFSLPFTSIPVSNNPNIGPATYLQTGTASFTGTIVHSTTTTAAFNIQTTTGNYTQDANVAATIPFTWANTHVLMGRALYEAA